MNRLIAEIKPRTKKKTATNSVLNTNVPLRPGSSPSTADPLQGSKALSSLSSEAQGTSFRSKGSRTSTDADGVTGTRPNVVSGPCCCYRDLILLQGPDVVTGTVPIWRYRDQTQSQYWDRTRWWYRDPMQWRYRVQM